MEEDKKEITEILDKIQDRHIIKVILSLLNNHIKTT